MTLIKFNILSVIVIYIASFFYYETWTGQLLGGGDTSGYYLYLPSFFIHGDIDSLHRTAKALKKYYPGFPNEKANPLGINELQETGNGTYCIKYPCGVAFMAAPFFLIADVIAPFLGYQRDGYSPPYAFLFCFSTIFYVLSSLWFIYQSLKCFFTSQITAWTIIAIFAATNLHFFTVFSPPMSHPYLFFLYSALIWSTIKWHEKYSVDYLFVIGFCAGAIAVTRPVEIICILIPVFFDMQSLSSFKDKWINLVQKRIAIPAALIAFFIPVIPQLIYWKITTGSYFFYSYGEEGFDFLRPHLLWGLFSFKNGWLAYTPVMLFALAGCLLLYKNEKFLLPVLIFLPVHIYITYSWWCWNYINGFGSRPMISAYPLLAIPMGYFIQATFKKPRIGKWIVIPLILFFSWLNIFSAWQFSAGLLWTEDSNWAYQKRIFGKTSGTYLDFATFDSGEDQPMRFSDCVLLLADDFENANSKYISSEQKSGGEFSCKISADLQFGLELALSMREAGVTSGDWIKAEVHALTTMHPFSLYDLAELVISFTRENKILKQKIIRIDNKLGNKDNSLWSGKAWVWDTVHFAVKVPGNIKPEDEIKVYVRNPHSYDLYIDDLKIFKCKF